MNSEYNVRLSKVFDDVMMQFPMVARKVVIATRSKKTPLSSAVQLYLLEGLMISPMTPTEISRLYCISKPNVTTMISKLIEGGFVQRSHDENDRRVIYVTITDKGRQSVYRKRKIVKKYILKMFDQLGEDEIQDIFTGMENFRNILVKMNNIM